jgi:hypothetical protein
VIPISGEIQSGLADAVADALERTPRIERLELESPRGSVSEGLALVTLVQKYSLATAVTTYRDSACSMCWYSGSGDDRTKFSKWLPDEDEEQVEEFFMTSDEAYMASATSPCQKCGSSIVVICIYCESGSVLGEPRTRCHCVAESRP